MKLSFGENGWSPDLVRREDVAGFGVLSLAHRGCSISSRVCHADDRATGWRAGLTTAHFRG